MTQLGQGYSDKGEGYSHHVAGTSNIGAYKQLSHREWNHFEFLMEKSGKFKRELSKIDRELSDRLKAFNEEQKQIQDDHEKNVNFLNAMTSTVEALTSYVKAIAMQQSKKENPDNGQ